MTKEQANAILTVLVEGCEIRESERDGALQLLVYDAGEFTFNGPEFTMKFYGGKPPRIAFWWNRDFTEKRRQFIDAANARLKVLFEEATPC